MYSIMSVKKIDVPHINSINRVIDNVFTMWSCILFLIYNTDVKNILFPNKTKFRFVLYGR